MGAPRDTYKYQFKRGNRVLHMGITNDLERREQEHQRNINPAGHIKQVGRRVARDSALAWESEQRKKGKYRSLIGDASGFCPERSVAG